MKKITALLLALVLLLGALTACQSGDGKETETPAPAETPAEPEETEETDPLAGLKYNGATFFIQTSVNLATDSMSSSNDYIQGRDEFTGDAALDEAIRRNQTVEKMLDVSLRYEQVNYSYSEVATKIRQLILTGDTTYQLLINDIYGLVPLTPEWLFHNADDGQYFDFSQPWWYEDFMDDISLNSNHHFVLAGDYFIDQLRSTHCLIMNRDLYRDLYGDPDTVYDDVNDRKWTIDRYTEIVSGAYRDLDGNISRNENDQYGSVAFSIWGPMIPWLISADPGFIERDSEGYPVITVNNERSYTLLEKLLNIYYSQSSYIEKEKSEQGCIDMFAAGQALFLWYQRLGTLESNSLRATSVDFAVLPYPMLDDTQKDYVTAAHDTAEMGFIPCTVSEKQLPFVSAVIEALCRETYRSVLPIYYESSLKIKYTRDSKSAQMIDIIHDHYGNAFVLAWSDALSDIFMQNTFNTCIEKRSKDFASNYKKNEKTAVSELKHFIELYESRS